MLKNRFSKLHLDTVSIFTAAILVSIVIFIKYYKNASFWLDEAAIAIQIRNFTLTSIFAPLDHSQYFPRILLLIIAGIKSLLGYKTEILRFLPFLFGIIATFFWALILWRKSKGTEASLLAASMLIGSTFWLFYAYQLKQYSFDVLMALIPFLINDSFFENTIKKGNKKLKLVLLCVPIVLSYTYIIALCGRILGFFISKKSFSPCAYNTKSILILGVSIILFSMGLYLIDLRYNLQINMTDYWSNCILKYRLNDGPFAALKLLLNSIWGWQAHLPRSLTAGIALFQGIGVFGVLYGLFGKTTNSGTCDSKALGSILVILLSFFLSLVFIFPICCDRTTLFLQIHTQLITIRGVIVCIKQIEKINHKRRLAIFRIFLLIFIFLNILFSGKELIRVARIEVQENIRPLIPYMDTSASDTLIVHEASYLQVSALPEPLPFKNIIISKIKDIPEDRLVFFLWTHLSEDNKFELEELKQSAKRFEVLTHGVGCGIALVKIE